MPQEISTAFAFCQGKSERMAWVLLIKYDGFTYIAYLVWRPHVYFAQEIVLNLRKNVAS